MTESNSASVTIAVLPAHALPTVPSGRETQANDVRTFAKAT